jgi:DNA polymerase-3 subunit chi
MTQIDFYFNAHNKLEVIRKLVVKATHAGSAVLLYTRDASLLQRVDQYLWTAQTLNFIPHVPCRHPLANKTPVLIGDDPGLLSHPDILINLDADVPACFTRFSRLLEVVSEDATDRDVSRLRFRYYKERGFSLITHDLKKAR